MFENKSIYKMHGSDLSTFFSTGHEEDLQSLPKVPRVEAETRAQSEAVEIPRAEHATLHHRS